MKNLLLIVLVALALIPFLSAAHERTAAAPAGTIAYMRGGNEIRLIEPDGRNDRGIWTEPDPQFNYRIGGLAWRPDATEIAFSSDHETTISPFASDLYAIRPDGSRLRKLTNAPAYSQLASYPKGRVTLVVSNRQFDSGPFLIYIQGAAAAQSIVITPGDSATVTFDDVADFGAIGQEVVAIDGDYRWLKPSVVDVHAGATVDAGAFPIAGDGMRRFGAYGAAWRSDGSSAGFILGDCVAMYQTPAAPPIGSAETPLLNAQSGVPACLFDRGPTPALANQILYGIYGGDYGIYRVTEGASGPGEKIISYDTPDLLLGLNWLPDGSGFLFSKTTNFDTNANIYEYNFADGTLRQLTQFTDELAGNLSISPDGQFIVFERTATLGMSPIDLWMMRRDGTDLHLLVHNGEIPSWSRRAPAIRPTFTVYMPTIER